MKVKYGEGKWSLRQVLYNKYVPKEMMERPNQGFGLPIEHWLRGLLNFGQKNFLMNPARFTMFFLIQNLFARCVLNICLDGEVGTLGCGTY